jgi:hypothetical protein
MRYVAMIECAPAAGVRAGKGSFRHPTARPLLSGASLIC